ncbi:amidohydrolase family protein [Clostridium botulinum]|uniref:amidohydrolase family protein n=1 Tax=Clostridium botulinum TaxID=1491 RepID=UPI0004640261|nr:amidohydrolase family protein [Clostridium botulinum]APQ99898.1 amidohydrolase family protein [Clostridium botulinum]OSA83059.1 amidohydrolase [Clostridium botulinum]
MIIDGHSHVILPAEKHIEIMDKAGVDKTILFSTTIHPERTDTLEGLKKEMKILNKITSGERNSFLDAKYKSIYELKQVIEKYPNKYIGFGSVPVGLNQNDTNSYIEENIVKNKFAGIGEFTLPSGQIKTLATIFESSMIFGKLPIWIHAFNPLILQDIKEIAELSKAFPDIPVILGHMGGSNWLTAIELAKEIPNLYLDTSAYFSTLVLKIAVNELPLKCIFGVDMPYGDLELSKEAIKKVCSESYIANAVLGDNIANLLKL